MRLGFKAGMGASADRRATGRSWPKVRQGGGLDKDAGGRGCGAAGPTAATAAVLGVAGAVAARSTLQAKKCVVVDAPTSLGGAFE